MALAYTAPTWTDGSGTGISASQLQALCNCIEGLVQGSDKAVHGISMSGSTITLTFADGSQETTTMSGLKGISSIAKTGSSGLVDTYTVTYTDGTTSTFTVTNGKDGTDGADGVSPGVTITAITGGHQVKITDADHPAGQTFDVMDGVTQDISGKADKVAGATNGNFAGLDSSGNLTDSGNKASDFLTSIPIASANDLGGIKVGTNLSIDANGVLSASGGSMTLAGLDDTTISAPSNGQDIVYDNSSSKWINKSVFVELTQAQYDTLVSQGAVDPLVEYHITDGTLAYNAIDDNVIGLTSTWSSNKINSLLGLKVKKLQSSTYTANGTNTYRYYLQQMFNELVTAIAALEDNEYLWMDSIYMGIQLQQNRNHFYKKGDSPSSMSAYGVYVNNDNTQMGINNVVMSATLNDCRRSYVTFTFSNNAVSASDASTGAPANGTNMYLNYYIMYV